MISPVLEDISDVVDYINTTIMNTIIPYLEKINKTTNESYNYLKTTIYPKLNDSNSTIYNILKKWDSYNASQLYEKINETYNKTVDIYTDIQSLVTKWGTYTAAQLYNISNETYYKTVDIYNNMATASSLSSMQTDATWLVSNVATQENMTLVVSKIDTIDANVDTLILVRL